MGLATMNWWAGRLLLPTCVMMAAVMSASADLAVLHTEKVSLILSLDTGGEGKEEQDVGVGEGESNLTPVPCAFTHIFAFSTPFPM